MNLIHWSWKTSEALGETRRALLSKEYAEYTDLGLGTHQPKLGYSTDLDSRIDRIPMKKHPLTKHLMSTMTTPQERSDETGCSLERERGNFTSEVGS